MRLVRVVAPSGYGKSTLAAAWAHSFAELPDDQRPAVTWLSIFENLDAERCLNTLTEALVPALPALQNICFLEGSGESPLAQRTRMLCSELNAAPRPIALVIDDYHLLTDPASHAVVQQILDSTGHGFLLVLLSRTTPPLQVDRLILNDAILTISQHDLALDHGEFLAFMQLIGMDSHPPDMLRDLEQRCTGWIAAIKLLTYDLRHPIPAASNGNLPKYSDNAIRHFIESSILDSMPQHLREFTLAAAPLPWMSADLMAAVTGTSPANCADALARLINVNCCVTEFTAPSGELRFRFHPLVQEVLQQIATDRVAERRRAAAWFLTQNDVDTALRLLSSDIDPAEFAEEFSHAIRNALIRFDITTAQRWLSALPATLLETYAALAVNAAWAAYFLEAVQQLDDSILRAKHVLRGQSDNPATNELRVEIAVLMAYWHTLHGRKAEAAQALAEAETTPCVEYSLGNGYRLYMRALLPVDASDFEARTRLLQHSADIFERIGHHHGVIGVLYFLVLLKRRCIDLLGALTSSTFLQSFAERQNRSRHIFIRDNLMFRGEMLYVLNRIGEAREIMQQVASNAEKDGQSLATLFVANTYLALCDAADAKNPAAVLRTLDEAAEVSLWVQILEYEFSGIHGFAAWPRILRHSRAGHPELCRQTAESLRLTLADLSDETHDLVRLAILGGAVLGEHDDPRVAAQLDAFLVHLNAVHFPHTALHVRILRVLHAHMRGDKQLALERLRELLPDVERSGMLRLLLDFHALQPLLRQCDDPFADQVLTLYPAALSASPILSLTTQEARILAQLAGGFSTKQVASSLSLTHKTIYTHIHRIFKKLGVHSRKEAVQVWQGSR